MQAYLSSHVHKLGQPQIPAHLTLKEVQEAPCEEDHSHGSPEEQNPNGSPSTSPTLTLAHVLSDDVNGLL